jgi:molybdopterin/thiamine biosynthesis adenylyltransferase
MSKKEKRMANQTSTIDCHDIPEAAYKGIAYRLLPRQFNESYYHERTDRNIGWITQDEQDIVRSSAIAIAGCGGMGGELAEAFLRLGVGEIRIADNEVFEISNINRQSGATRFTIGKSKALETAKMMRAIADDTIVVAYPTGISENTVFDFLHGCHALCDEIEFWCIGSRILLHRAARELGIPVFVCSAVGFGAQLFLFTPRSMTVEECLGFEYEEAVDLERKMRSRNARPEEVMRVMRAVTRSFCSEWPEYCADDSPIKNRDFTERRLREEGCGSVIATNPPFACGFAANRALLALIANSGIRRVIAEIPEMPGYCYFDAAKMETKVVKGRWW